MVHQARRHHLRGRRALLSGLKPPAGARLPAARHGHERDAAHLRLFPRWWLGVWRRRLPRPHRALLRLARRGDGHGGLSAKSGAPVPCAPHGLPGRAALGLAQRGRAWMRPEAPRRCRGQRGGQPCPLRLPQGAGPWLPRLLGGRAHRWRAPGVPLREPRTRHARRRLLLGLRVRLWPYKRAHGLVLAPVHWAGHHGAHEFRRAALRCPTGHSHEPARPPAHHGLARGPRRVQGRRRTARRPPTLGGCVHGLRHRAPHAPRALHQPAP
mmetsp:Transcript_29409/g.79044  ORF Transcript_29409/g.79044 Transcript_29409/m.79044 type:complete len:268 (+) Transcript_29409:346-1149(+)